jgi:glycine/D-amino acid oxidase-like deaminating enzyme
VDDDLSPRPALEGNRSADVAILGAGFTGLWTAYYLLKQSPGIRVILLEREIAGFGASGRNGGWCSDSLQLSHATLVRRFGRERVRRIMQTMFDTVDEVGRVLEAEGIDAHYRKGGRLEVARGTHQLPALEAAYESIVASGLDGEFTWMTGDALSERVRINQGLAAIYSPHTAVVHPGRLVRGLARVVERLGGTIYEQTPVTGYTVTKDGAALETSQGRVTADHVVLAGEAYLSAFPQFRRRIVPLYSLIVLTEPLPQSVWDAIGWSRHECIDSMRYSVDYLSRTTDGRILFGGRGAPYHYGSAIRDAYDRHRPTHIMLEEMARRWFSPWLDDVKFTHAWGGPLGMPRDWMPAVTTVSDRLTIAGGYTGHGVAMSNLFGRIVAETIAHGRSTWDDLPFVGHHPRPWEPEPLRYLGIRYVQRQLLTIDSRAEHTGRAPTGHSLAERLSAH